MSWKLLELDKHHAEIMDIWAQLSSRYHNHNHFLASPFFHSLLTYFRQPRLFAAIWQPENSPKAILILHKRTFGIWETYKPAQAQIALALCTPETQPDLVSLVKQLPGLPLRLDFYGLDTHEHQPFLDQINPENTELLATDIQVSVTGDVEDYWKDRPRKLRQNISRYYNRLEREKIFLDFKVIRQAEDMQQAIHRYGLLESKGWKGKCGTALHPGNRQGQFYSYWLKKLAEQQQSIVFELFLNNELVASRLCCFSDGMMITLKTTYDEEYRHYAPGRILLKQVVDFSFLLKEINLIDFYTNATQEQLEWSTRSKFIFNASIYSPTWYGSLFCLLLKYKQRLRSLLPIKNKTGLPQDV